MKEAFELIRKRLEPEADFFSGEPMGSLQKAYYCKGVEKAFSIVSEVEAEFGKDINVRGNGWIPCSERLPEVNTRVMCFTTNKTYVLGEYGGADSHYLNNKDVWFSDKGWYRKDSIIAWMPLPEPYKPEKGV